MPAGEPRRPLIAVTGPSRGSLGPRLLVHLGVLLAGGRVVHLSPARPTSPRPYRGVIVTGGHDIDPVLYAQQSEVVPHHDRERDIFESRVIDAALARGLPLLGICRGAQLLNVRLGGDLHQELTSRRMLTSNRWTILPLKTLVVEPSSMLHRLIGSSRARINSLHNQAIDRLGRDLKIAGKDLDGIVQAVENRDRDFLLGVQWHPEYLLFFRCQRRLFKALVAAARIDTKG